MNSTDTHPLKRFRHKVWRILEFILIYILPAAALVLIILMIAVAADGRSSYQGQATVIGKAYEKGDKIVYTTPESGVPNGFTYPAEKWRVTFKGEYNDWLAQTMPGWSEFLRGDITVGVDEDTYNVLNEGSVVCMSYSVKAGQTTIVVGECP